MARRKNHDSADYRQRAMALFEAGKNQIEIAAVLGVSQGSVSRYLHDARNQQPSPEQPCADDDDTKRGFDETCEKARREYTHNEIMAAVQGFAKLSELMWDLRRQSEANRYGVPLKALDREVKKARLALNGGKNDFAQPHWEIELSQKPVATADLLQQIISLLKSHVVFPDDAAKAAALWLAFDWTHDAATHSPMLLVTSAERDSGKTTLLGLVCFLSRCGLMVIDPSPAVLFRMIEKWRPTLIVDEADDQFKENPQLRAIINSGWTRGAGVPRCNPTPTNQSSFLRSGRRLSA